MGLGIARQARGGSLALSFFTLFSLTIWIYYSVFFSLFFDSLIKLVRVGYGMVDGID